MRFVRQEEKDQQWKRAMDYLSAVSELNYMTQIVIMLYEDNNKVWSPPGVCGRVLRKKRTKISNLKPETVASPFTFPSVGQKWARCELNAVVSRILKELTSEERFHVELHFSPGVKGVEEEENAPTGFGFRPASAEVARQVRTPGQAQVPHECTLSIFQVLCVTCVLVFPNFSLWLPKFANSSSVLSTVHIGGKKTCWSLLVFKIYKLSSLYFTY